MRAHFFVYALCDTYKADIRSRKLSIYAVLKSNIFFSS